MTSPRIRSMGEASDSDVSDSALLAACVAVEALEAERGAAEAAAGAATGAATAARMAAMAAK